MENKILNQNKNPLLQREEYLIEIKSENNPSFEDIKQILKTDDKVTVIKKINGGFGKNTFHAEAYVYDSEDARKEIETIPKKIREKIKQEEKKAAEEAAAKKAEEEKAKQEAEQVEAEKTEDPSNKESTEESEETKQEDSK